MATEALQTVPAGQMALSSAEIRDQVNLIQEVMKAVMKDGIHFGKIPGCGDKPALLKPGSEKILATFKISVEPIVQDLSTPDEARFRVITKGVHMNTGIAVGYGVGEASSSEDKYKWRASICDAEFDETPETRRRKKWKKGKNDTIYQVKQIRTEPADVANTVLKIAKKRSQIDMTLTATAASDVFSQDIEDLPEELREMAAEREARNAGKTEVSDTNKSPLQKAAEAKHTPPPATETAPPSEQHQEPQHLTVTGPIQDLSSKAGMKKSGEPFIRYGIKVDGNYYGTFSETFGKLAADLREAGTPIRITYTDDGKFRTIETLEAVKDTLI